MRFNAKFADLVGPEALSGIGADDLGKELPRTVDDGWIRDESGAWLLRDLVATYHGSRELFNDVTGFEAAVNGRAVPDLDIAVEGRARAVVIARRGSAFARAALQRLNVEYPDHPLVVAYVSISDADPDDDIPYEGDVTFVAARDDEPPYLADLESITANAVLVIDSTECLSA